MDAVYLFHDLYGYLMEMSPDIAAMIESFEGGVDTEETIEYWSNKLGDADPRQFVEILVAHSVLLDPKDLREHPLRVGLSVKAEVELRDTNGAILGVIMGTWDGRRSWIFNAAVDQNVQRQGIDSLLAAELEKRMRAKGASQVGLLVDKNNYYAQDFFEALGFTVVEDELVMSKKL